MLDRSPLILMRIALVIALLVASFLATTHAGTTGDSINDKLAHLLAFFGLACLADFSFPRARFGLSKIVPLLSYGLMIEIIQFFLPYRTFSLLDLAADTVGIAFYLVTLLLMSRHPIVGWRRVAIRD